MKLADYLDRTRIARGEFATLIGATGGWVTQLCQDKGWPSREMAQKIAAATNGQVTANDFMRLDESEVT